MQSTAAQFIQVRIHLVLLLTHGDTPRLQPFCHWCGCCTAEERVNDVAYHGTCEVLDQLRNPKTAVYRSLTQDATCHLVQSLILSRIDYYNVVFAGLPQRRIIRLQTVINAAARLVLRVKKSDRISILMRDELKCLKIGDRIRLNFSILVHKCLNNTATFLFDRQDQ